MSKSNRAGRPPLPASMRRSAPVVLNVRKSERDIIAAIAASQDVTVSSYLRGLFIRDMAKRRF